MATTESLVFDANRVQEEQEEELKQEEDERQQELKDLLANAFDDIEADDTCSFVSDDSHDSGRHSGEIGQQNKWNGGKMEYHASTPVSESKAPPLVTPRIHRKYNSVPASTSGVALQHSSCNHGIDTLYQEPDVSSDQYESNLTQQSDGESIAATTSYQMHHQGLERNNARSYPSSHTSHHSGSDVSLRQHSGGMQHSPLCREGHGEKHHSYNGSAERHLTGSSDIDNTVFINSGEQKTPTDKLQERYFQEGAGSKNTQLGILYQAKSRQLQELQEKFELLQLESSKELRMLRHEVALLQGSKQGCESSLKHTQSLLTQNKEARFDLQKTLDGVEEERNSLARECEQLKEQLCAAESSIESLNAQIFALGSSDTVERMREQHESLVSTIRRDCDAAKRDLTQQLADLRQRMHKQTEEMDAAKLVLKADTEAIAQERVDHAETVNRLTLSLKESQRQIQDLLSESCGEEMGRLKIQLQQMTAGKAVCEELCTSLQKEVGDLKEQISLYESAQTAHNLFSSTVAQDPEVCDDTLIELGLKPLGRSSSKSTSHKKEQNADETVLILRQELQKCLGVVKEKRTELSSLRSQINERQQEELRLLTDLQLAKDHHEKCQVQLKEANIELNLYKSAAGEGRSLSEVKLSGQVETLANDKAILQEEIKCLNDRLELVAGNEAKLGEINAELNSKLAEMIDDFDRDKKAALERCQETMESHNQTVKEMMRSEMKAEYELKHRRLETEMSSLREKSDELSNELRHVKELYVQVCAEKRDVEQERTTLHEQLMHLQRTVRNSGEADKSGQLFKEVKEMTTTNSTGVQTTPEGLGRGFPGSQNGGMHSPADSATISNGSRSSNQSRHSSRSSNHSLDRGNRSLSNSQSEVKILEDQLRNEKKEKAEAQEDLLRARLDVEASRRELEEVQQRLSTSARSLEESNRKLKALESELGQLKVIIADLRTDNQKLDKLLSGERVQLTLSRDDVVTLQGQVSELKQQLNATGSQTDQLHSLTVKLEEARKNMSALRADLEMERATHQQAKEELQRLTADRDEHEEVKRKLSAAVQDLQAERRQHLQTKAELDKKGTALQTEITSHNRTKIEASKVRTELAEVRATTRDLVDRQESVKLQAELESEKLSHLKTKQALDAMEAELAEGKASLTAVQSELEKISLALDVEANGHKETKTTLEKVEKSFQAEVALHKDCKVELNKVKSSLNEEVAAHVETKNELKKTSSTLREEVANHNEVKAEVVSLRSELSQERSSKQALVERSDLVRVQTELAAERESHETLQVDYQKMERSIASEKLRLSLAQAEIDKKDSALQEESSAHRQSKAEISKLRAELEATNAKRNEMVSRVEFTRLQSELERERQACLQAKQELEHSSLSEKSFQSLTRSTLSNVQQQLQTERSEHEQTQTELARVEEALQSEQTSHNNTKIQLVTLETELSTERANQADLRRSLEKIRANQREQESEVELLRTNQSKDGERIAQLKAQRQQEKVQLEGLKASHSQVLSDLNEAKAEQIRRMSELSQLKTTNSRLLAEMDLMSRKAGDDRQKLIDQQAECVKRAVEEARRQWNEELSSPSSDMAVEKKLMKEKMNALQADVENYERLLSQADEHFEQQLAKIRAQMQEEYTVQIDKLTKISNESKKTLMAEKDELKAVRERHDSEVNDLKQQLNSATHKASELESKCKEYQSCTGDLRKNLQSLSAQTDSLKVSNRKLQVEITKKSGSFDRQLELLSKKLQNKEREMTEAEHEHGLTVQSLKQKLVALRNEQALQQTPSTLQQTPSTLQRAPSMSEKTSCACQTLPIDVHFRQQYDMAIHSIRVEVLNYVEETNRNAAQLIRCEIHKAKQATARQLRNYYVKCFKQSLQDNRSTYEEKLSKLERTLDNAVAAVTPPNINADSILSLPTQLLTESLRCKTHNEMCADHTLAELYSRGPTPVLCSRLERVDTQTPTLDTRSDTQTPVVTDADSRYSYVPLRHATTISQRSADQNGNATSSDIIRELGLDNTETSPPRWYNPPPEKLNPSPYRPSQTDSKTNSDFVSLRSASSKR